MNRIGRYIGRRFSTAGRRDVAVAISGGVDSSVAAYLLSREYGEEHLLGVHMSNWNYHGDDDYTSSQQSKCWMQDWKDANSVAEHLKIDMVHTSFEREYWNDVFEPYVDQLARNITPNPDVDCNRVIKFGVLKSHIRERYGIETLATGHYARIWDPNRGEPLPYYMQAAIEKDPFFETLLDPFEPSLLAARDPDKDQSYFLTGVKGNQLRNVLFPLGDFYKKKLPKNAASGERMCVREIAARAQLPTANKPDSMGICFVGKRKHGQFVHEYIDPTFCSSERESGQCVNVEDGLVVCKFDLQKDPSLLYSTVGQGAKISGASQKWFVVDRPNPTTVVVCPGTHHPALYADSLFVDDFNWIAGHPPPTLPFHAQCRIRHLQPLVNCEIRPSEKGYEIVLERPLRGIAPGQICAIYYDSLLCLGGGAISRRGLTYWEMEKDLPQDLHPSGKNDMSVSAACG